jgi:methionine-S-sulfoxide reductase
LADEPTNDSNSSPTSPAAQPNLARAILGGGCFWCLEALYSLLISEGVVSVKPGYAGGSKEDANYKVVCGGGTKHAEVVEVVFDQNQKSYREILEYFFKFHDPTTLNRQGNDVGTQYRSVIFPIDDEQKKIAEEVIAAVDGRGEEPGPVVTKLEKFEEFFEAEEYHHNYFRDNSEQTYCRYVILPKLKKWMESSKK